MRMAGSNPNIEILKTLQIIQRFLARTQPLKNDQTADEHDAVRELVRNTIKQVTQTEGLELTELTEEQYRQVLSSRSQE